MNNVEKPNVRDFKADRKICEAATGGSWDVRLWGADWTVTETGIPLAKAISYEDARFIAEARTGWPAALDRIAELEADVAWTRTYEHMTNELRYEVQRYKQALESIVNMTLNAGYIKAYDLRKMAEEALEHGE